MGDFTEKEVDRISDEVCKIFEGSHPAAVMHALESVVASVIITCAIDAPSAMKATALFGNAVSEYVADNFKIGANPDARN